MNLVELDIKQIKKVYNERMVYDFPQNELRPLARIIGPLRQGKYECFGLNDGDNIIGYVYLAKQDNDYLVDYLAMYPKYRNKGLGGEMLCLLKEYLSGADNIILEVEDPDSFTDYEYKSVCQRRISFYIRNGFFNKGVNMLCFDVPYLILSLGNKRRRTEEIEELYFKFYRMILPNDMFEKNIHKFK
ncbi:GNAT family N-acetyltransferase [Butyrivibrio sp. JL13D10]|uniref:GNAT family N-acetyltransferase n=1 Tax=Butyrivibrio sp. JL13D10 TaxID=3236815 RepID=UPI0038B59E76